MAKCGNHGQIIPRDRELLRAMYWDQNMTSIEMGRHFGVEHKSVLNVMRELGIPRRGMGPGTRRKHCAKCDQPVFKIKHAGNGAEYGTLCRKHWNEHRAALAKKYGKIEEVKAKKGARLRRWYFVGAIKPEGEDQWLNRSKIMLRNARRLILKPKASANREALQFLTGVSGPGRNSQA